MLVSVKNIFEMANAWIDLIVNDSKDDASAISLLEGLLSHHVANDESVSVSVVDACRQLRTLLNKPSVSEFVNFGNNQVAAGDLSTIQAGVNVIVNMRLAALQEVLKLTTRNSTLEEQVETQPVDADEAIKQLEASKNGAEHVNVDVLANLMRSHQKLGIKPHQLAHFFKPLFDNGQIKQIPAREMRCYVVALIADLKQNNQLSLLDQYPQFLTQTGVATFLLGRHTQHKDLLESLSPGRLMDLLDAYQAKVPACEDVLSNSEFRVESGSLQFTWQSVAYVATNAISMLWSSSRANERTGFERLIYNIQRLDRFQEFGLCVNERYMRETLRQGESSLGQKLEFLLASFHFSLSNERSNFVKWMREDSQFLSWEASRLREDRPLRLAQYLYVLIHAERIHDKNTTYDKVVAEFQRVAAHDALHITDFFILTKMCPRLGIYFAEKGSYSRQEMIFCEQNKSYLPKAQYEQLHAAIVSVIESEDVANFVEDEFEEIDLGNEQDDPWGYSDAYASTSAQIPSKPCVSAAPDYSVPDYSPKIEDADYLTSFHAEVLLRKRSSDLLSLSPSGSMAEPRTSQQNLFVYWIYELCLRFENIAEIILANEECLARFTREQAGKIKTKHVAACHAVERYRLETFKLLYPIVLAATAPGNKEKYPFDFENKAPGEILQRLALHESELVRDVLALAVKYCPQRENLTSFLATSPGNGQPMQFFADLHKVSYRNGGFFKRTDVGRLLLPLSGTPQEMGEAEAVVRAYLLTCPANTRSGRILRAAREVDSANATMNRRVVR